MNSATLLADRYVELWNEPDPLRRREEIARLWLPDGEHHVRTRKAVGHAELEARVRDSHDKNVQQRGFRFRLAGEVQSLHDALMFHWEMVRPECPQVVEALGLQLLRLAPDGRIRMDYQFVLPTPPAAASTMTSEVIASSGPAR
jgi:hypothetical protein